MAKELYLYSPIYDFVAEGLIAQMEEYKEEDMVLRINSPGGRVFAGWGIIAKIKEIAAAFKIRVDGCAASMAAYIVLYCDDVEALDVSKFLLHRADSYIETPEDQQILDNINKDLKTKLKAKIDTDKLKEIKGVTIDELFNPETRLDLWLTAKEAKAIGLINKIVKLDPIEAMALNRFEIAAEAKPESKIMTLDELKAQHPKLFAEAVQAGIMQERDRVSACLVFNELDPVGVKAAIESGNTLSQKQMAEFAMKAFNAKALTTLADESAPPLETKEESTKTKTEAQKQIDAFDAKVRQGLGLNVV